VDDFDKGRHYWFYGEAHIGKTRHIEEFLIKDASKCHVIYPKHPNYDDLTDDIEFMHFKEFNG